MKAQNRKITQPPAANTVDPDEIERFSRIASQWWDANGKFKPLHVINPLRIGYIRDHVMATFGIAAAATSPLKGLSLLDIGCGGGLICEPMARLGATVTGIDASEKNIKVATLHAQQNGLDIDYRATSAEALVETGARYDVVLALEIIEHVADIPAFVEACCKLLKPNGLMVWSTINRTPKSYALAIIGAEYVLRWLPRGTHTWSKFVKPSELHEQLRNNGFSVSDMTGMTMNPLNFKWKLTKNDLSVNYLLVAQNIQS